MALSTELDAACARYDDDMGRAEAKDAIALFVNAERIAAVVTDAAVATRGAEGGGGALGCEDAVLRGGACAGGRGATLRSLGGRGDNQQGTRSTKTRGAA